MDTGISIRAHKRGPAVASECPIISGSGKRHGPGAACGALQLHCSETPIRPWWILCRYAILIIEVGWRVYASANYVINGSDNGLSHVKHQAIIWTYDGLSLIRPLWIYFGEIWIKVQHFLYKNVDLIMSSAKWQPFCISRNMLNRWRFVVLCCGLVPVIACQFFGLTSLALGQSCDCWSATGVAEMEARGHLYKHGLTLIPTWKLITSIIMCGMKLLIHS